ncbi:MAG: hypothetical protein IBX50_11155 [Marinospirillum sp.]|uniref:hypothetical protein n=1 Tax=Marinospirillum sp. TaxID=2183934 RepID=UPI001A05ADAD|nr:hypothetical protein [Marinospirillum sp.]MBE0507261.1 hypothetical protein [Marinospirillum sp.]
MDLLQSLGLAYRLLNQHPFMALIIVVSVLGAALWMGGFRPVFQTKAQKSDPITDKAVMADQEAVSENVEPLKKVDEPPQETSSTALPEPDLTASEALLQMEEVDSSAYDTEMLALYDQSVQSAATVAESAQSSALDSYIMDTLSGSGLEESGEPSKHTTSKPHPDPDGLKIYRTPEQLNRWVEAIHIKRNPADPGFVSAVRQYFIGLLRYFDAHQDAPDTLSVLRNIKSIRCRNTEEMVVEIMLRSSNRKVGQFIEQTIETILQDQAVHVEWPSYPFSSIIQRNSADSTTSLVGEYAGYLVGAAQMERKVSITELELKIHDICLKGNELWVIWRYQEAPTQEEHALLLGVWEGFNGMLTEEGQTINFKYKVLPEPEQIDLEVDPDSSRLKSMFRASHLDGGIDPTIMEQARSRLPVTY